MRPHFKIQIAIVFTTFAALSPLSIATQSPDKNAWEELRPDSAAFSLMKKKCQDEAKEDFLATRENVRGIYLESDDDALSYVDGGPSSYGISYSNPPYMYLRNGLDFIEYSSELAAIRKFGAIRSADGHPYIRFNTKTRDYTLEKSRSTPIRISYKRTTTTEEERLGVYGRLIEVVDDSTNTLLAKRRDYVWLNPDKRGPHGGFICPTIRKAESFPISFLNKVINVQGYRCRREFEEATRLMPNKFDTKANSILVDRMNSCEKEYFK